MAENPTSTPQDEYRAKLLRLAPRAIKLLKLALTDSEVKPCQVKAAELVLRGCRVVEDGRVLDELAKVRAKSANQKRVVKVRYTTPKLMDGDAG